MLHPDAPIKILDEVVIAAENKPSHRAIPDMVLLKNGDLLVVYRVGTDHHITHDGVLVSRRSSDGGKTWEHPRPVFARPGRNSAVDNGMIQLNDGRIMLHFLEQRYRMPKDGPGRRADSLYAKFTRVFRTFSTDNGMIWSEPEPFEHPPPFIGWAWPYGRHHELDDGRIMMPLYGAVQEGEISETPKLFPGEAWAMTVVFSSDGGRTFPDQSVMASNPAEERKFSETDILRLRSGRFLAVLREETPPFWSFQSCSDDDGRTWTPYEQVNFKGHCPRLVQLHSGAILCAYRDVEPDRPGVSVSVSEDDGATWRWVGQIYSGSNWDCGYPVIVRLPDQRLFCAYYSSFVDGDCEIRGMWLSDDI